MVEGAKWERDGVFARAKVQNVRGFLLIPNNEGSKVTAP